MKNPLLICIAGIMACQPAVTNTTTNLVDNTASEIDAVQKALVAGFDHLNNDNLSDSLVYNQYKKQYNEKFTMLWAPGQKMQPKDSILEGWRGIFASNRPRFTPFIDRIEVSGNLAYVLYHYREEFFDIKTNKQTIDVQHTAIAVLRKNTEGKWQHEFLTWN